MSLQNITTSIQKAAAEGKFAGRSTGYTGSIKFVQKDVLSMALGDPSVSIPSEYYRTSSGTPLLRVEYRPFPHKYLFLEVLNGPESWGGGAPDNFSSVHGIIRDIDYNKRASDELMPSFGPPTEGIDGYCWITAGAPVTKNIQSDLGSNISGIAEATSSVDKNKGVSLVDFSGGGSITISDTGFSVTGGGDGAALLNIGTPSRGNTGDFEIHNSLSSTKADKKGFIIQNIIRKMIGVDQNVVILPFWEDLPDINKILTWANLGVFVYQVINKLDRLNRAIKSGDD